MSVDEPSSLVPKLVSEEKSGGDSLEASAELSGGGVPGGNSSCPDHSFVMPISQMTRSRLRLGWISSRISTGRGCNSDDYRAMQRSIAWQPPYSILYPNCCRSFRSRQWAPSPGRSVFLESPPCFSPTNGDPRTLSRSDFSMA